MSYCLSPVHECYSNTSRCVDRTKFLLAKEYLNYINGQHDDLVDEMKGLDVNEGPHLENGGFVHEVSTC